MSRRVWIYSNLTSHPKIDRREKQFFTYFSNFPIKITAYFLQPAFGMLNAYRQAKFLEPLIFKLMFVSRTAKELTYFIVLRWFTLILISSSTHSIGMSPETKNWSNDRLSESIITAKYTLKEKI